MRISIHLKKNVANHSKILDGTFNFSTIKTPLIINNNTHAVTIHCFVSQPSPDD